jgi:hypothetical protein
LRHKLLESYRQRAIEHGLRQIDLPGIPPEFVEDANHHVRQNARAWRIDAKAANEIEARLLSYGFDQHAINVEVYLQAREVFLVFEQDRFIACQAARTAVYHEDETAPRTGLRSTGLRTGKAIRSVQAINAGPFWALRGD